MHSHNSLSSRCRRNKRFKEEALSIQAARIKYSQHKQKQNMKVKLINAAEGMTEDSDRGVVPAHTQPGENNKTSSSNLSLWHQF